MTHSIVHLIAEWSPFDAAAHLRTVVLSQVQAGERVAVAILSANPEARDDIHALGATCVFVRQRWQLDPFAMRECVVQLRTMHPRVVQFWGERATEFASLARWALPKANLIATLPAEYRPQHTWREQFFGSDTAKLDCVIVDYAASPSLKKAVVIPPGPPSQYSGEGFFPREQLLAELELPPDAQLITIAGPLTRSQLIDEAIWNFELVRTLHEPACLVILGDGPDRPRLERYARLVSEPSVIRFVKGVGSLYKSKTPDPFFKPDPFISHSAVYWQPGRSTSIPTALLAAQSWGIPAVANDVAPHAQVITHGKNGFLVPTEKRAVWTRHTVELLEDAALREQFGAESHSVIR